MAVETLECQASADDAYSARLQAHQKMRPPTRELPPGSPGLYVSFQRGQGRRRPYSRDGGVAMFPSFAGP